jgi:hypothetical protein
MDVLGFSTNIGFVHFDIPLKRKISVNLAHILTDFMGHSPSGLIRNGKLSLKFFGWNTMTGSSKEIDGIKPFLKGCMGILEGSSYHWMNMVSAKLAGIGWNTLKLMKLAFLFAGRAFSQVAVANRHQMRQAGIIIGKLFEKFLNVHGVTSMNIGYVN